MSHRLLDLGPRYEPLKELGRGATGRVYLVRDTYLGREVALKLLQGLGTDPVQAEELRREFALLAGVEHPGIARVFDFGHLAERPYFTREYIDGEPLCSNGRLEPPNGLLELALDLSEAVAFLHQSRILHLDLKPGNVILRSAGRPRSVLIDFGLYRRGLQFHPGAGLKGSLSYLAPEFFGREQLGPPADIYALGATLYQAVTGALPRPAPRRSGREWIHGASLVPLPRRPSELRPDLPAGLGSIILKCLALDSGSRFQSGAELREALLEALRPESKKAPARPSSTGTLGRREELERLDSFLARVFRDTSFPNALLISGPPGSGQTHLFREAKVRAQTRGLALYVETGYPGRAGLPGALLRALHAHLKDPEARWRWKCFLRRIRRPQRGRSSESLEEERRMRRASELVRAVESLGDRLVLAVDGLQHFDEVSVQLVADLVRTLTDTGVDRPPLALVLGYREEGPSLTILRELSRTLLRGGASTITLKPLSIEEAHQLWNAQSPAEQRTPLGVFQETGGWPGAVLERASVLRRDRPPRVAQASSGGARQVSPDRDQARLRLALELAGRPVSADEAARFLELSRGRAAALLRQLEAEGAVAAAGEGERGWLPASPLPAGNIGLGEAERRRLHLGIARALLPRHPDPEDPKLLEALHHFQAAGASREMLRFGPAVAAYLKGTYQNRAALTLLRALLAAIPRRRGLARLRFLLEVADLEARVGEIDQGIGRLREELAGRQRRRGQARARVLLRLGLLHARRGDYPLADALLEEGLSLARRGPRRLDREEIVFFMNEEAAVKLLLGDHAAALGLCAEGLALARRSRSPRVREAALNLIATRANVALRGLQYEEAIRGYQAALQAAEALGSLGNRAVILNNLGNANGQSERYEEAERCFREAESICIRIDSGPSLVSIRGNLAVLLARRGRFPEAEEFLQEAARPGPQAIGRRQEFLLAHSRGLCLLYHGRYREARLAIEEALRRGESLGDRYLREVEEVYRLEALIFEGAYAEALEAAAPLVQVERPPLARRMALARLALLEAWIGRREAVGAAARAREEVVLPRPVHFLDAWDRLFLGWAFSLSGLPAKALPEVGTSERFFRAHRLDPGFALAQCVRAECHLLAGGLEAAHRTLPSRPTSENRLERVFHQLLAARLLLSPPGDGGKELGRCADLIAGAEASLAGNPLPEFSARSRTLRAALEGQERSPPAWEECSQAVPAFLRSRYLEAPHRRAWSAPSAGSRREEKPGPASLSQDPAQTRTALLPERTGPRARLVARSAAMRRVIAVLDRLRGSELPVLIEGETGSGKEIVARIIHAESPRAGGPFVVIDCGAVPPELFEAEIFGARAGAFTGQAEDREGILAQARGGTVLFDEVANLPPQCQPKLLRVLSQRSFRPLGAAEEVALDVRCLFSTSRDLEADARAGLFRADLLHRIRVLSLRLPPLRDRGDDLPFLVRSFLEEDGGDAGRRREGAPKRLGRRFLERLRSLPWPGNVRELRNLVFRLKLEGEGAFSTQVLERALGRQKTGSIFGEEELLRAPLPALKKRLEREYLVCHFRRFRGNTGALCRFLGLSRRQLYRRALRLGIQLLAERKRLDPPGAEPNGVTETTPSPH